MKDFSQDMNETPKMRYVTRWNLEKSNPAAEKSPPKKPIIFWIERTVPREYRQYVRDGILEWNKAFEKLGFIDAIQVRDQQSDDEFDPEDIRYNTFRWITTSYGFAIGPSRTNPKTGEILDADIIFDEGMIRYLPRGIPRHGGRSGGHGGPGVGPAAGVLQAVRRGVADAGAMAPVLDRFFTDKPAALEQFRRSIAETRDQASHVALGTDALARNAKWGRGCNGSWPWRRRHGRPRRFGAGRKSARKTPRPGGQGDRDARGRPHARPAA